MNKEMFVLQLLLLYWNNDEATLQMFTIVQLVLSYNMHAGMHDYQLSCVQLHSCFVIHPLKFLIMIACIMNHKTSKMLHVTYITDAIHNLTKKINVK